MTTSRLFGLALCCLPAFVAGADPGRLVSRPRPPAPVVKPLPVGEEVRTETGQRRRAVLPDGSVLFVNEQTRVQLVAARRLKLSTGEIAVVTAPGKERLVVETPKREVTALGTTFAVRAGEKGTGVLVAHGRVQVGGLDTPLTAGQQLSAGGDRPEPAARASHLLGWTRDLMAAAESPLVPKSDFRGGALVAVDPDGQEAKLALRRYHVDVVIEDGFARTTIDQTYFNHHHSRLEGTFHFPLPADASLSRLAMYVDGTRMDGGMVERDQGRNVYETIVNRQKDPALLEWVDGTTFKMRVFPLEPRQEKRVLLCYTQRLPFVYNQAGYRFPAGHTLDRVDRWSFQARVKQGADSTWNSPSHTLKPDKEKGDLVLRVEEKDARLDRDMVLTLGGAGPEPGVPRFATHEHDGARYLMMRYRPALSTEKQRQRRDWVVLFESSGDRDPLLARTQIEVVRGLLQNAEPDDTFSVLTASTRVRLFEKARLPFTPENVGRALAFLESAHLVGALDLEKGLRQAGDLLKEGKDRWLVHVGSGIAAMGERKADKLLALLPEGTRYVGVGVGRRWDRAFFKTAAEKTGGHFCQVNPDEPLSWRTFELAATLNTPRLLNASVTDTAGNRYHLSTSLVPQGEELCAITRIDGKPLPQAVELTSTVEGQTTVDRLFLEKVTKDAAYLPREWARLEIDRLLAEDAAKHKDAIVGLSKSAYVMTPFTSLLVLENEAMYQQYKVERGRKEEWAPYDCPDRIDVVYEPEDGPPGDPKKGIKPAARQVARTMPGRTIPQVLQVASGDPTDESRARRLAVIRDQLARAPGSVSGEELDVAWDSRAVRPAKLEFFSGQGHYHGELPRPPEVPLQYDTARLENVERRLARALDAPPVNVPLLEGRFSSWELGLRLDGGRVGQVYTVGNSVAKPLASGGVSGIAFDPSGPRGPLSGEPAAGLRLLVDKSESLSQLKDAKAEFASAALISASGRFRARGTLGDRDSYVLQSLNSDIAVAFSDSREGEGRGSLLYRRPAYSGDERLFFDLVAYAPGLHTSAADALAVLETEAAATAASKAGEIDADARKLFESARKAGWRTYRVPAEKDEPELAITFDGAGRFVCERVLAPGIREQVVCDGETLWHLYPDLNLAARRAVSRFHRMAFAATVPWVLPRPDDLARGADLKMAGDRTVAVVPHGIEGLKDKDGKPISYHRLHYVFGEDGLAEQQVVEMPAGKVQARLVLGKDGGLRRLDKDGKETGSLRSTLKEDRAPKLTPETKDLVVLSLPYRTREHLMASPKYKDKPLDQMPFEDALALLAADFAAGKLNEATEVYKSAFHARDRRPLGLFVLLAACGANLDSENLDVLSHHPDNPLAHYLALHTSPVLRKHASQWASGSGQWGEGYLRHLAQTHALFQRWQNSRFLGDTPARRQAELKRALDFVSRNEATAAGWALLGLVKDRTDEDERQNRDVKEVHRQLAKHWPAFERVPALADAARYETARSLYRSGDRAEARRRFIALYEKALADDALLLLDEDFRKALVGTDDEKDQWQPLLRRTAKQLVEKKRRPALLVLARQCRQLGDAPLAADLLAAALDGVKDNKERLYLTVAAVGLLREAGETAEAEKLLMPLLEDAEPRVAAGLWRLAHSMADGRERTARQRECLERALDAEFAHLPDVINIEKVGAEYGQLLNHYENLVDAMTSLKVAPPPDFLGKVVRAADRWRSLGKDEDACGAAARVLRKLGERDLAWDYLTTPVGRKPHEAGAWQGLAESLRQTGERGLADEAYAAAFAAEPTNAQLLWDRARNLQQSGRDADARRLLRQLVDGSWQERFRPLQAQARWQLEQR